MSQPDATPSQPTPESAPVPAPAPLQVSPSFLSPVPNPVITGMELLKSSSCFGLMWAGMMLVVMGLWFRADHPRIIAPIVPVLFVLGIGALALGLAQFYMNFFQKIPMKEVLGHHLRQRTLSGIVLIFGSLGLVGIAIWMWSLTTWDGFPQYAGLGLFSLVGLWAGWKHLRRSVQSETERQAWKGLDEKMVLIRFGVGAMGIILGFIFLFLVSNVILLNTGRAGANPDKKEKVDPRVAKAEEDFVKAQEKLADQAPEVFGLFLFAIFFVIFFGISARLPSQMALQLLGGVSGAIFLAALLGRAFLWRSEVFGTQSWTGPDSWKPWLVIYGILASLSLTFFTLLIGRNEIRNNSNMRVTLFGYDTFLQGFLLLIGLALALTTVAGAFRGSYNWSPSRGFHTLAQSSKNLVSRINRPVTIYAIMNNQSLIFNDVKHLLTNCQNQNTKINVKYWEKSHDRDEEIEKIRTLGQRFPEVLTERGLATGLLVVYGEMPNDPKASVPHAFIPERRLFEEPDMRNPKEKEKGTVSFKGEGELMKEINYLVQGKKDRKIYFLQGHGEADPNVKNNEPRKLFNHDFSKIGVGNLAERLKKEKFEVKSLRFSKESAEEKLENTDFFETNSEKKKVVPDKTFALVIAGSSEAYSQEEIKALENYMDRGGRLMVFLDLITDSRFVSIKTTELETFLQKYGVVVGKDFTLQIPNANIRTPLKVIAETPANTENAIAKQFAGERLPMPISRIVRPNPNPGGNYKAEVILELDPRVNLIIPESSPAVLGNADAYFKDLKERGDMAERVSRKPIPIAVAVSEGTGELKKNRMIVFGNTEFICNSDMVRQLGDFYFDFISSGLEWIGDREEFIGAKPKESKIYNLRPGLGNSVHLVPIVLMGLVIFGLGIGVWMVRRR